MKEKTKPVEVVIDRRKWLRGRPGEGLLLDPIDNKMCCLGFAMIQVGRCRRDKIRGIGMPSDCTKFVKGLNIQADDYMDDTKFSERASIINDKAGISDEVRERRLIALAKKNGFIFTFIN